MDDESACQRPAHRATLVAASPTDGVPMRLIGMLDSPYVRRVAISLTLMDVKFRHEALSVFRNWDAFAAINPVVKAPTAVTDNGTVLMDSALILEYAERLVPAE